MRTKVGGFDDGGEPEELDRWLAAGFAATDAEVWLRWRFTIAQANAWIAAEVTTGVQAAQWSTAGVGPETVAQWREADIEAGEAVRWHEFGVPFAEASAAKKAGETPESLFAKRLQEGQAVRFGGMPLAGPGMVRTLIGRPGPGGAGHPGDLMRRFRDAGVDGRLLHSYFAHQWLDESALEWALWGIAAEEAYLWFDLGLRPHEAGRLTLQGRSPGDVVREWWAAGIPFDEVADWIGAGLSAAEAVAQRERGITAEHAAALRALRQEEASQPSGGRQRRIQPLRHGPARLEHHGPPPPDEDAARAAIERAFAAMDDIDETKGNVPSVEGSDGLAVCRQQSIEMARQRFNGQVPNVEVLFTVNTVRFINENEAVVTYTAQITGSLNITLGDRPGRALLVDGEWKVARETFCDWLRVGGVECPPRRSR